LRFWGVKFKLTCANQARCGAVSDSNLAAKIALNLIQSPNFRSKSQKSYFWEIISSKA